MKFQSFSLVHQKLLVNADVFKTDSADILLKGVLSAEIFLLIGSLSSFSTGKERDYIISTDRIYSVCGLVFTNKTLNKMMRDACDLSVTINTKNKKGLASMIDEIKFFDDGSIGFKLNQSFDFLRVNGAFEDLNANLPFKYNTVKINLPEIGQQIALIA